MIHKAFGVFLSLPFDGGLVGFIYQEFGRAVRRMFRSWEFDCIGALRLSNWSVKTPVGRSI